MDGSKKDTMSELCRVTARELQYHCITSKERVRLTQYNIVFAETVLNLVVELCARRCAAEVVTEDAVVGVCLWAQCCSHLGLDDRRCRERHPVLCAEGALGIC